MRACGFESRSWHLFRTGRAHRRARLGVVPSPDPYARALLAVLVHEIGNVTQLVTTIRAVAELPDGHERLAQEGPALTEAGQRASEVGWLLGVLAGGAGTEVLRERREARGLRLLLELAAVAIRREGGELCLAGPIPALHPGTPDGWSLPWTAGALLFDAALAQPEGALLAASFESDASAWRLCARGLGPDEALAGRLRARVARVEGLELELEPAGWSLRIPPAWLVAG